LPSRPQARADFYRRRLTSRSDVKARRAGRSQKKSAQLVRVILGFAEQAAGQG